MCAARALASAQDADLVFVGRSPEPLFHLLSGVLAGTSWRERLLLLNISMSWGLPNEEQARALAPYLRSLGLDPPQLLVRPRRIALVDVVDTGSTFGAVVELIREDCERAGIEWRAVARKIRIVGLTWRTTTSPKTWRWQQHAPWTCLLERGAIKNVSTPWRLASSLASDATPKMTGSFTSSRWADPGAAQPLRDEVARQAVAFSLQLYRLGRRREARERFARELAAQHTFRERWLRSLALEIKR